MPRNPRPEPHAARESDKIVVVQALRFVAAMLVLASHAEIFAYHLGRFLGQPVGGSLGLLRGGFGVDMFFAISGFVMILSAPRLPPQAPRRDFMRRRVVRIVPLYWLATLFVVGWKTHINLAPSVRAVLASLFFAPHAEPPTWRVTPVLEVGWTLNYEMAFYLLFALALGRTARTTAWRVTALIAVMVTAGSTFAMPMPLAAWCRPILLEFTGGMAVALAWQNGVRLGTGIRLALVLIALGLVSQFDGSGEAASVKRTATAGIAGAMVLAACVLGPLKLPFTRAWIAGGDISYALYLCHMPLMMVMQMAWRHYRWPYDLNAAILFALACTLVSLLVAWALHRWLERPLTRWLNDRMALRPRLELQASPA